MYDKTLKLRITGVVPLLMHNGQMRDPLNPIVQKMRILTQKRKKTEADLEEISRLEWYGGLYISGGKAIIPGDVLEGMLRGAARRSKRGKDVELGIICDDSVLEYKGPKNMDDLWNDQNFRLVKGVVVQRNAVMRTRPMFKNWGAVITIRYSSDVFNESDVLEFAKIGGEKIGVLDWRPKYGRFSVEKIK